MVHESLKSWWSIAKAKKHDGGFKEAEGSDEHGLSSIFLPDMSVVIAPMDIKLGEESRIFHIIN